MKMLTKLYRFFFPVVTYEWFLIGNTIGRHFWKVEEVKCFNGYPAYMDFLTTLGPYPSKEAAQKDYERVCELALEFNVQNGYASAEEEQAYYAKQRAPKVEAPIPVPVP